MLPENYLVKTNSKEETSEVIVFFDPNEKTDWTHWEYVSVNKEATEITNIWNIIPERYLDYPVYEFSEWKRLVILEKWCIKVTDENKEELKKWWDKQPHNKSYGNLEGWMLSDKFIDGSFMYWGHSSPSGYNKITFEQFKQITMNTQIKVGDKLENLNLVEKNITCYKNSLGDVFGGCTYNLNNYKERKITKVENGYFEISSFNYGWFKIEEAMDIKSKKIIGYKLIKLEYENAAEDIVFKKVSSPFTVDKNYIDTKIFPVQGYTNTILALKEAGVLDLWFEPIYKEEILSKTIEIGTQKRKAEVFKDKVIVTDGVGNKRTFTNDKIELLCTYFTDHFAGFEITIPKIHIGCDAGIELGLDDLVLIIKTQKEL